MANLKIDWFGRSLSHRADKTSNTYAKVNSITGKTFLVTLRNPYTSDRFKDANIAQNNKMGALWMGIAAWVKQAQATGASAEDAAQLARFVKGFKSQHKYATLRGYIAGKRYATVAADYSSVTIKDLHYTKTVEFEFNARPLIEGAPSEEFEGSNGSSGSSSEQGGNGSQQGGSNGSEQGSNGSQTPSQPAQGGSDATGDFTITAAVGNDGGGSVTIKKNGVAVEGSSVQASATDSIVLTAVEDSGYQFLGWADGNSDNPRTITPSADATFTASFMDLSNV